MASKTFLLGILALSFLIVCLAVDNKNLLDFCVADSGSPVFVNGAPCKDPKLVQPEDFFLSGLHIPGNTSNPFGYKITLANVAQLPGLNTLGISFVRIDYAVGGVNPPHIHPRGSEILTVLEGSLEVGFITSGPDFRHIYKVLQKGDVFVFPVGLVHYQRNIGNCSAVAIAALNSQNPGTVALANAILSAKPDIKDDILAKSFRTDIKAIGYLSSKF